MDEWLKAMRPIGQCSRAKAKTFALRGAVVSFPSPQSSPLGRGCPILSAEDNPDPSAFHCPMRAVPSP